MFAAKNTAAPSGEAVYIESVFSTYLYTGNGSTQTITNGIDLSGKGGLVWIKDRAGTYSGQAHQLTDTVRGYNSQLSSNSTGSASSNTNYVSSFSSTGFVLGNSSSVNGTSTTWASWTFRKQAKFFDIVTYTGDGTTGQVINHNLGSVPGCIIVKNYGAAGYDWKVWHRLGNSSGTAAGVGNLNTTSAFSNAATDWFPSVTSTSFTVSSTGNGVNNNGNTFVAYLFAHDAGGFGAAGTDNVISCATFTGPNQTVTLGYEPQWILYKDTAAAGTSWQIIDNMRGMSLTDSARLFPNSSGSEVTGSQWITPTATGFITGASFAANTFIYIAIRRGPMKTPTSGTSVFSPQLQTPSGGTYTMAASSGFPVDWLPTKKTGVVGDWFSTTRLTNNYLSPNTTAAEGSYTYGFDLMQGVSAAWDASATVSYAFRRAPGFFDVVCYTGNGSNRTITHNLGVAPELMIVKSRSSATFGWFVYHSATGNTKYNRLDTTAIPVTDSGFWNNTSPTSTTFTIGTSAAVNASSQTEVVYLFATLAGVSKVGSYTGNGSSQTINCGFAAGARFVMIKRTDSTGDWYVWDTARGIVTANDPHLSLNTTAAEVTTDDSIDPDNSGFIVNQLAATNINVSSASYIFLAIS